MEEFLEIAQTTTKAESTLYEHEKRLEMFSVARYSGSSSLEIGVRDIQRYLGYLKGEKGFAHNTIRLKFAAVSQFYKDVVDKKELAEDSTEKIRLANYAPKRP